MNTIKLNYVKREELENLKSKLINKVLKDLNNKYSSIIKDKYINSEIYDIIHLKQEIEKNFDFNIPNYDEFLKKIERIFLKKITTIEDKRHDAMLKRSEVENISNKINNEIDNRYQHIVEGKTKRNKIREDLRKKEKNEWAMLIQNNYKEFLDFINKLKIYTLRH